VRPFARASFATAAVALVAGGSYFWSVHSTRVAPEKQWAVFDQYCVDCHNRDDRTAGIAFDELDAGAVAHEPALFEEAVRKLRGRMMPPPGGPQPDQTTVDSVVAWLEATLDDAAAADPNPGSVVIHRLNRTEYANAIRDLLGLQIDAAALLPKDDVSDGFDNVANVLKVSPSFLDQYIAAAGEVSYMAIGDPGAKLDSRVYYAALSANQNFHVDGMPLGTRGGLRVDHLFPADGDYEFSLGGLARARYVEGLEYRHRLIATIDGVRVFEDELGGPEDMEAVDLRQAAAVAEINSRFEKIRVPIKAGPHSVGATFVARTMSETDAVLQPFIPGGGEVGIIEGEESPLKIARLQIDGPFDSTGIGETPSRNKIFTCRPQSEADEMQCARQILAAVTRRAFRRPIEATDLEIPMQFFRSGRQDGTFESGIRNALTIILADPEFLYRAEPAPEDSRPGSTFRISDIQLASRLSFFLWSSIPDDELLALAERGDLGEPRELEAQVKRMLADPRAEPLVTNFAFQWLDLRNVRTIDPDPVVFPEFNRDLGLAFARELELFLASIMLEDHGVLGLLDASHTFVNERLALHYGIDNVRGDQFRRVELTDPNRWGLFGKGGILMATSYPNRTAPVLRGAWILEAITGTPPAAPPPNVEAFPETVEGEKVLTVRERLEQHRANPNCAGCHSVMDPLGFALENFDAIGQWRAKDRDAGEAIDSSGQLAGGTSVDGPVDLRNALLERPDQFVQTLTEKLMIYALGRSVEHYDMPAIREIVRTAAADEYRFSSLLTGIVNSAPFRMGGTPDVHH
jgi:mono/diheme cytochrome c family protein